MSEYSALLAPGKIGNLELRNRIFQTAMGSGLAEADSTCGDDIISYYEARAAGGAALLIVGAASVSYPRGKVKTNQVGIGNDSFIPGLKRLTDAVHRHGAKIAAQLHRAGLIAVGDMIAGFPVMCPSLPEVKEATSEGLMMFPEEHAGSQSARITQRPTFKEMDEADIAELIQEFADAAARAVTAGFDGVEIHAGHGYIIADFLSPSTNRRTDRYGGSRENRARLMREIVEAVRARVGPDFPVWCKLDTNEYYIEGGLRVEDGIYHARIAEAAGADAITVTATHNYNVRKALFSSYLPHEPGKLIPFAAQVKAAVSVPVITVGRIEPDVADKAIRDGKFDFLAMGRKQIADNDFTVNLMRGGAKAVRPCIYCYTCLSTSMLDVALRCSVNGDVGYEKENLLAPAATKRKVVVVGGGPGGMEAARRLTLRGHDVTLLEATGHLGGTARIAAIAYEPNGRFVEWLKARLEELKVDVRLNTMATLDSLKALGADAVVVATGAIRRAPDIPGKDLPHVQDGASLRAMLLGEDDAGGKAKGSALERLATGAARALGVTNSPDMVRKASKLWMPVGDRVVIIGGDLVGMELAEFLHERGRKVDIVDDTAMFGAGLSVARRTVMFAELEEAGVGLHVGASQIGIGAEQVEFIDSAGSRASLAADTVIIAKGAEPNRGLYEALKAAGFDAHIVGDCDGVGYIQGAVRTAADVAARI